MERQYAYNGAGDLFTLTDGDGQATTLGYDAYGRMANNDS